MSKQEEPQKKKRAPWYTDKTVVYDAMSRAFSGYKGTMVKRWNIIPIAVKRSLNVYDEDSDGRLMYKSEKTAGLVAPHDDEISKKIRRMHELCAGYFVLEDESDFSYIAYDVVDATGAIFPFEMTYHNGSADANTGFFAAIWDRATGNELAYCNCGGDNITASHWKDKEVIERYVPHERQCRNVTKEICQHWEINRLHTNIVTTYTADKNQLEMLIGVAAELTSPKNAMFFPRMVPEDVMAEARDYLFGGLICRFSPEVLELIWSYMEWRIFLDHDVDLLRLNYKPELDEEDGGDRG